MRFWLRSIAQTLAAAAVMLLLVCLVSPTAQSFVIGYFSRIYFGSTSGPQIRWGSADPTLPCTPGSMYAQKTSSTEGDVWKCTQIASGQPATWTRVAGQIRIGDDFYATQFGAKCDGFTDDTVALQNTIDAAFNFAQKAGRVIIPAGICQTQTLTVGPITNPFQAGRDDPLNFEGVGFQFTAPRNETIHFTANSSAISWTGTALTSDDIGNYIFYGPFDATYAVLGENRILKPIYGCEVTAILTSTTGTCVATPYEWADNSPLTTTTGNQSAWVTDDHDFSIDNSAFNSTPAFLDPAHVGKTMKFVVPVVRAYLAFDNTDRPGSHLVFEPTPAPCTGDPTGTDDWQCLQDENIKSKYFSATITAVTDPTHGKMHIEGMNGGSNWVDFFPDAPVHGAQGGVCGGPEPNCASNAAHQWGHLVDPGNLLIGQNPHLDDYAIPTWMSAIDQYQNKHTYLGNIFPYSQPVNTDQRFISIQGSSQAATTLNFTGCPATGQFDIACVALAISRNKYFHMEDITVNNVSGSSIDDENQWGVYMGGLPGVGTQALAFTMTHVQVNGFGVCYQMGDSNGGEMSDASFHQLAAVNCGYGIRTGPGSFNTLDLYFYNLLTALCKVGFYNYEGNMFVENGGSSFNTIDFISNGFGPFSVKNYRTEGPGIHMIGGEPGFAERGINLSEPQASRTIVGDVTATPNSTHTVAGVDVSNVSVGVPANSFYPITFTAGTITVADLRKIAVLPGAGPGGIDSAVQIWEIDSTTTGQVFVAKSGAVTNALTGATITVYDNQLADLTFGTDQVTPGDVGGSLALPNASLTNFWPTAARCIVTSVSSSTTGQCGFYLGNQGAGPIKPVGGTDTAPHIYANIAVQLDSAPTATLENNVFGGMVTLGTQSSAGVRATINNNQIQAPSNWPVTITANRKHYALTFDPIHPDLTLLPVPTSAINHNVGLDMDWALIDPVTQVLTDNSTIFSQGNNNFIPDGPIPWPIYDGVQQLPIGIDESLQKITAGWITFDTFQNPFALNQNPALNSPYSPMQQLYRVKTLSEAGGAVDGRNLRVLCTFATSDTCTWLFVRNESISVDSTTFEPLTRTWPATVTSGHFTQADVGKKVFVAACCSEQNGEDFWGYVTEITNATHIKIRQIANRGNGFQNGTHSYTAVIGENEPDAKYLPSLWGCNANETVWIDSFSASQVVLKSSNATSTAGCLVGIIR